MFSRPHIDIRSTIYGSAKRSRRPEYLEHNQGQGVWIKHFKPDTLKQRTARQHRKVFHWIKFVMPAIWKDLRFCDFLSAQMSDINAPHVEVKQMLNFIWWLIIGLIAGALARLIMPGRDPMGIIATILLGILGSVIGGLVSWAIWGSDTRGFQPAGFLLSILGAIVVLWIWRMTRSRSTV